MEGRTNRNEVVTIEGGEVKGAKGWATNQEDERASENKSTKRI